MHSVIRTLPSRLGAASRVALVGASLAAAVMSPDAAGAQTWSGALSGLNEVPSNTSTGTGFASLTLNGSMLSVSVNWSGLSGPVTAGHIHCCTNPGTNAGVAVGFAGLPLTTSGTYTNVFDLTLLSTYNNSFIVNFGGASVSGAAAALVAGLNNGLAYVNLHNAQYPGGEIRANLTTTPTTVLTPEPGSIAMLAVGLMGVGVVVRRKRRST